jgi:hypothetical protein
MSGKIDRSDLLRKQQQEDRERTEAIERARLAHVQREQEIRDQQQRSRENEGQGRG